ncbi:hemerythrin domain-containing protein [Streptomyces sp. TRM66268-LWL]|uniref:Hemerythrin domain-containing protein n=1 Tax=Streptomyces polyasparticus TaxID=2767826 RepID=A0ABR7SEA3_9ACTN|nr:hemerythrin domain-containing protein [Streptomyces polyasparticus]MBC9712796.1 hemerythrin domain-containing protein [Streptomyces polyasparticus]
MSQAPEAPDARVAPESSEDAVALLMRQHGDIRNLFDEVEKTSGEARADAFRRLVHLLAVHETAEEEVLHPMARTAYAGAEKVVEKRLAEEKEAKELLSRLDGMDTEDPKFLPQLLTLRTEVMKHARAEERYEFLHIRRNSSPAQLATMAKALRAAEATAPTHPHPGVESATKNALLGPVAAIVDRTRDAVRKAMGR